jgi:hypothetical protein
MTVPQAFLQGDGVKAWTSPRRSPNIIVLSRGCLYFATIAPAGLSHALDRFSMGSAPEDVLGDDYCELSLPAIERTEADVRHKLLRTRSEAGSCRRNDEFRFARRDDCRELAAAMRQQLGDRYLVRENEFQPWRALRGPILLCVALAVLFILAWLVLPAGSPFTQRLSENGPSLALATGAVYLIWTIGRLVSMPAGFVFERVRDKRR